MNENYDEPCEKNEEENSVWENSLLRDLREHVKVHGAASGEDFAKLTCVPSCIKNVLTDKLTEDDLFTLECMGISYANLAMEIAAKFVTYTYYPTKASWNEEAERELREIERRAGLFPRDVLDCFRDALFMIRWEWDLDDLLSFRERHLAFVSHDENELYLEVKEHVEKAQIDDSVMEKITCIPEYMRMTLLGIGDGGLSEYNKKQVTLDDLFYDIIRQFLLGHDFEEHSEWIQCLEEELILIRGYQLLPKRILECFEFAFYDLAGTQTSRTIGELRRMYLEQQKRDAAPTNIDWDSAVFGGMFYWLKFPKNYDEDKSYPLIFFFHGEEIHAENLWESIDTAQELKNHSFFKTVSQMEDFPFIVAALCLEGDSWFDRFETVKDFVRSISASRFCDRSHIYAIGAGTGGYAVWQLGISIPEDLTAIIPICGGGMYQCAKNMEKLPVWAFHGEKDEVTDVSETLKMAERIRACGGNVRVTVYPEMGHEIAEKVYAEPALYEWLLANDRYQR